MTEGYIQTTRVAPKSDSYNVHTNCGGTENEFVGTVRRERDYSVAAKRRKTISFVWYCRAPSSAVERGPYPTRKAAAAALV